MTQPLPTPEKRGLFRLIADIPALIIQLFREEIEAFKRELELKLKGVAVGVGLFVGAAMFAFLVIISLMLSAIFALSLVMPVWAAALIVAVVLAIIAVILVFIGRGQLQKGDLGKSAVSVQKDINAIKGIGKRDK